MIQPLTLSATVQWGLARAIDEGSAPLCDKPYKPSCPEASQVHAMHQPLWDKEEWCQEHATWEYAFHEVFQYI